MKVILLRDVAKIGRRYEIVNVPDGYALNKLIPQKDAQPATPVNVKRVNNMREKDKSDKAGILITIKKIIADLEGSLLVIPMQANAQGHLFQSVHTDDVVTAAKLRNVNIPKEYLHIEHPIKSVGEHSVILKSQNESFPLLINVVAK